VRHRLFVILLTDRQKNTHRQKDKLLSGGNEWGHYQEHASRQWTVTLDALHGNSRMSGHWRRTAQKEQYQDRKEDDRERHGWIMSKQGPG